MTPIVMIVFDDLFNIHKFKEKFGVTLSTPNLDRLAEMGVTFENAFASTAVCNPSRTSAMTGLTPFQTGLHTTRDIQWQDVVPEQSSIVSMIGEAGYETFGAGKVFHNSSDPDEAALFDRVYDHHFQERSRLELPEGEVAGQIDSTTQQADDSNMDWVIDQLEAYDGSGDPMFMTAGIIRPHRPFIAPSEFYDLYPRDQIVLPFDETTNLDEVSDFYKQFRWQTNFHEGLVSRDQALDFVQGYLASLSYADAKLGELLDAIEANPALEDATIAVWSDHGYELGDKLTWNKFTLWEEAANIPFFLVDPTLTAGTTVSTPVSLLDLAPTLLAKAGVSPTPEMVGKNLFDVVADPGAFSDSVAITNMMGSVSLRTETHRLIFYNDGSVELYDIVADPEQNTNIAAANAALVAELTARLETELFEQGALFDPDSTSLYGTASDDVLIVTGTQAAEGRAGSDTYFVSDGATVIEGLSGGYDRVYFADFDFEVPEHVEYVQNHIYSNGITFNVTGNDQRNEIVIFNGRGNVMAGAGHDVVSSWTSRDTLDGGVGADFVNTKAGAGNLLIGGLDGDLIAGGLDADVIHGDLTDATDPGNQGDLIFGDEIVALRPDEFFLPNGDVALADGSTVTVNAIGLRLEADLLIGKFGSINLSFMQEALLAARIGVGGEFFSLRNVGGDDSIFAGNAADIVLGQGGNDWIDAGVGRDSVFGEWGHDTLIGGVGRDLLDGGIDNDTIYGGADPDRVFGGTGDDVIYGGTGGDILQGQQGDDRMFGGADDDSLIGGPGFNTLNGGEGMDSLEGGDDVDLIRGQGGDDSITALAGNDEANGGVGADWIDGGLGNDLIRGQGDADLIFGGLGRDTLFGGSGNDEIFGGKSADELRGQGNNDILHGDDGDDILFGAAGQDSLYGGAGDDQLFGGTAGDFLDGGSGNDILNAGAQADRFFFDLGHGDDTLSGFGNDQDTIQLTAGLVDGLLDAAEIIATFAVQSGGSVQFDFGDGDRLRVNNVTLADLIDDIDVI